MAEYFFKPPEPDWRAPRSNNVTGMSLTKNSDFKVPRIPSRYATQTLCSNVQSNQILESSAFDCMKKAIDDRFDLYKKLNMVPVDEVKQISTECLQKLDKLLADSLTQCILPPCNSAPSVINDNGSVFHTIISQASASRAPVPAPPPPAPPKPIVENPKRPLKVIPSDDENESLISFFKKNQSSTRTTKTTAAKNAVPKNSRSQSAGPSRQTTARPTQAISSRTKSVAPRSRNIPTEDSRTLISAVSNNVSVVVDKIPEPKLKRNSKPKNDTRTNRVANKRKDENLPPVEPKKRKNTKRASKVEDDFNITKNSLRKCNNSKIGYEQTDRELFGDVSSIVGGSSFQCSPLNVLKNMTKISSNKNDALPHLFSPFANPRSMSGVSAISTPLSKTISKKALNNRLKKPDVIAEFKGAKSRPVAKCIAKNDILKLDASQDSEFGTSDFSDLDENADGGDESTI